MHIQKAGGTLQFILDSNETPENKALFKQLEHFKLIQQGASVLIYNAKEELVSYFKPFDHTQLICHPDGYLIAEVFKTKRFPVGKARIDLEAGLAAQQFPRDLLFPLKVPTDTPTSFRIVDLQELCDIYSKNKMYDSLAELFNRCADFTPGKQNEYLAGGKQEDKFCRFNLKNNQGMKNTFTDHVFLLDESNQIVGTISSTIINNDEIFDIYVYDEIVDYFTLLNREEIEKVYSSTKTLQLLEKELKEETNPAVKALGESQIKEVKNSIAEITESKRLFLMKQLFAAARQSLRKAITKMQPTWSEEEIDQKINDGTIRAFIRAADGRVDTYKEDLYCSVGEVYVIQQPPTAFAIALNDYLKQWAHKQLDKANLTDLSLFSPQTHVQSKNEVSSQNENQHTNSM